MSEATWLRKVNDHRVKFDFGDPSDQAALYTDFDALITPRLRRPMPAYERGAA
jgi:hypothetical protein